MSATAAQLAELRTTIEEASERLHSDDAPAPTMTEAVIPVVERLLAGGER